MALPKSSETPRLRYLQGTVESDVGAKFGEWPDPTNEDFAIIGALIVLYSYVDLNLRRFLEVLERSGKLKAPWKGKSEQLTIIDVEKAIKSVPDWSKNNLDALKQLEEFRPVRNLAAHFAVKRFPKDDALLFITKSTRDYKQVFGVEPPSTIALTAVVEVAHIKQVLVVCEKLLKWLARVTLEVERQLIESKSDMHRG